jgi:acyl carrier protein
MADQVEVVIPEKLRTLLVEELGVDPTDVTSEASLMEDLGADSLDFVELAMAIERDFNIIIEDEEMEKVQTVGQLVQLIEEKTRAQA